MANLLQSSKNTSTCAPSYYTNYLSNLASQGQTATCNAQYVGAQPLQQQAFCNIANTAGNQQGTFQQGQALLGCAANQNITGAAAPYLCKASNTNSAQLAQCYMSPYIQTAVQGMSDVANRNIQQNLAPMATAAAVGSGQFGSQRGAQVLGQVEANAMQCLNTNIANLENTGYNNALNAATQKQQICAGIGNTAGTLTAEQARAKQAAGIGLGTLGAQAANQNIACTNALATLGGQQQTIGQNAQCFALAKLEKQSALMRGHQIPTSVKTTMCMSPFSAAGAIGSGGLALLSCKYDKCGNAIPCSSPFGNIKKKLKGLLPSCKTPSGGGTGGGGCCIPCCGSVTCNPTCCCAPYQCGACCYVGQCQICCVIAKKGGLISKKARGGAVGCKSLVMRGALPVRR
jgi:hypothetical protein